VRGISVAPLGGWERRGMHNALVAEQLPGPGNVFLEVAWRFLGPVRPGDVITAHATVTGATEDKPVTTLATSITNQDGVTVLDGTAVAWRAPAVAERFSAEAMQAEGSRTYLASAGDGSPASDVRRHSASPPRGPRPSSGCAADFHLM
jgi:hypothetical protein